MNIAEILKNKPKGTPLYSPVCGECALWEIKKVIHTIDTYGTSLTFNSDGKYCCKGEVLLFPSKEMRDWSKFAWKRGDVLESNDGRKSVIFDGFTDDTYTCFEGRYGLESSGCYLGSQYPLATQDYYISDESRAEAYIRLPEKRLGGKLNLDTLEMEPSHKYEFKPFDKVVVRDEKTMWYCDLFSHAHGGKYVCVGARWQQCLPYNEKTAKLICTKDDYTED